MSNQENYDALQDVLQAYLEETTEPSAITLQKWIEQYPQFEQELTEFAVVWGMVDALPVSKASPTASETHVLRGMSVVQNVLYELEQSQAVRKQVDARPAIKSIIHDAKSLGLNTDRLAEHLKMSIPLIGKLDRRLVELSSIPVKAIDMLAGVLQQTSLAITGYLSQPPGLAANASYKSRQKPSVVFQQNFFEAVRVDPEINPVDREYWLTFESQ
jgi:hypothetical protein